MHCSIVPWITGIARSAGYRIVIERKKNNLIASEEIINWLMDKIHMVSSSPPFVIRRYFRSLELLESYANNNCTIISEKDIPTLAMLSIVMTVTCVEAFFNLFFRILVEEDRFSPLKKQILLDLSNRRFGLEPKLRNWPEKFFNKNFVNSKAGKKFKKYKEMRNLLMHYQPNCEEIIDAPYPFGKYGTSNIAPISNLKYNYVLEARDVVKDVIRELFKMSGHENSHSYFAISNWTGEISIARKI